MLRIIIAEDDEDLRTLYCSQIRGRFPSIELVEVVDGNSLIDRVRRESFDLVLTDNNMQYQDEGLDAVKCIRTFDATVPLYVLSGDKISRKALNAGATGYIWKDDPLYLAELTKILKRCMNE